jgi:DNA-binding response OmpR family regulator
VAILDIDMPNLNGFGVCEQLRRLGPPYDAVPIVFLTVARSRALELLGTQLGAYVQKPVSSKELLRVVGTLIAKRGLPSNGIEDTHVEVKV